MTTTWLDAVRAEVRRQGWDAAACALIVAVNGRSALVLSPTNPNLSRTDPIAAIHIRESVCLSRWRRD